MVLTGIVLQVLSALYFVPATVGEKQRPKELVVASIVVYFVGGILLVSPLWPVICGLSSTSK
jgi:hypothetical protein